MGFLGFFQGGAEDLVESSAPGANGGSQGEGWNRMGNNKGWLDQGHSEEGS